ncbi:ABC transporter substrate-binding protein [Actinomyces lilanjuaniae]|uniref:ABC transporter substrate-binding protein n=1 Tax=Actinomyces lilanjuaniae TaxID=2321394 RepID=A0ABM6Z4P3_9ACTO|nr:ABC transporter substrate-binding protein [Actinomyces lilanjuaniae]AYD90128.1 ABC transporter substrate-binding protein [Actinomyces lilanjuaniae]
MTTSPGTGASSLPGPVPASTEPAVRSAVSRRRLLGGGGLLAATAVLSACSDSDPLAGGTGASAPGDGTVVVGSQQSDSNEIIAELYAQAMEDAGLTVSREYRISQRETYLSELESASVTVIPEYSGNLLQFYDSQTTAGDAQAVQEALPGVLPEGLMVLEAAQASDQDSYTVTRDFAQEHSLTSIGDLATLGRTVSVAANSEFEERPYGPEGAKEIYGVDVQVQPVEDSGGPMTLAALLDGSVDVADIYTADPAIEANDLVVLEDPEGLILPQNVIPLVASSLPQAAVDAINAVSALLTTEELRALTTRSRDEQLGSDVIASSWLADKGLVA